MTKPVKNVVLALALDDTSDAAWDMAMALDLTKDAVLHVAYVCETNDADPRTRADMMSRQIEAGHEAVQKLISRKLGDASHPLAQRVELHIALGTPADEIVQLAVDVGADVIVLGTREKKGLTRLFLGSVSSEVFKKAPCSVLVARHADYAGLERSPEIEPALGPNEAAMVQARPPVRYRGRPFSTYNANLFPTGIPRKQVY